MDLGFVESECKSLPQEIQATMIRIFRHMIPDTRMGHPTGDPPDPAKNFGGAFLYATTPSVASSEFTIEHGFGRVPYLVWGVLPLDAVNAQLVPLKTTKAADTRRIYLSSSVTSAEIVIYCEG